MWSRTRLTWRDGLFFLTALPFLFGCIATTSRSVRTLQPGQVSVGANYLSAENAEDPEADPVSLIGLDFRFGILRGFDAGIMHTWDITTDNENLYATMWIDGKVQLSNLNNKIGVPIFTTGVMSGYVYDEDADLHILSLPFMLGVPASRHLTPYMMYRAEWVDDSPFPGEEADTRGLLAAGLEINLSPDRPEKATPKFGVSVGWMNSLYGGDGDDVLLYNFGFSLDGPAPRR